MKLYVSSLKGVSLVALVLGLSLCFNVGLAFSQTRTPTGPPQPNIPNSQKDREFNLVSTNSSAFSNVPNSSVFVPAGFPNPRHCVIEFSTEVQATVGDRCDVALRVDNGPCSTAFGPEFFAVNETSFETHTVQFIATVSSAAHTFRPCFRVSTISGDAEADSCSFWFRNLTVECNSD
jgi:hypothetical protein